MSVCLATDTFATKERKREQGLVVSSKVKRNRLDVDSGFCSSNEERARGRNRKVNLEKLSQGRNNTHDVFMQGKENSTGNRFYTSVTAYMNKANAIKEGKQPRPLYLPRSINSSTRECVSFS